jgi:hypothetical protein
MKKYSNKLFCFSPPVMIATFLIEIALAIYGLLRYKIRSSYLVIIALVLLATFQLSEFAICGASSSANLVWTRIGYIAITMLPPLGLHIIYKLTKRKWDWLLGAAYLSGILFALLFGLNSHIFSGHMCTSNYAIFHLMKPYSDMYFVYYYGWLFVGLFLSYFLGKNESAKIKRALEFQAVGYVSFLLPTGIVNAVNPETMNGIPSIMCGFAVIYAVILAFGILPLMSSKKTS